MAYTKLNVFHWHLSEDQGLPLPSLKPKAKADPVLGFRVELRRLPHLHRHGSDGLYYTQEEIKDIVHFAAERGIRVVPELDMPGHTTAWFVGDAKPASFPFVPYKIERSFGVFKPALDPSREETYQMLTKLLEEMAGMFPDPYFHIGGDEVHPQAWTGKISGAMAAKERSSETETRSSVLALILLSLWKELLTTTDIQGYFNRKVFKILEKVNKTMVGWDEIADVELPSKQVVVQSWRGRAGLMEVTNKGHKGILSHGYYLDHLEKAGFHYTVDPVEGPVVPCPPP